MKKTKENIWFLSLWIVLFILSEGPLTTRSFGITHRRTLHYFYFASFFLLAHIRTSFLLKILFVSVLFMAYLFNVVEVVKCWSLLNRILFCYFHFFCRNIIFLIELFSFFHRIFPRRIGQPNLFFLRSWTLTVLLLLYMLGFALEYMKQCHL
jgi:hypothetical protein